MSATQNISGNPAAAAPAANVLTVLGELDLTQTHTQLRMPDGAVVSLPTSLLMTGSNPIAGLLEAEGQSDVTHLDGSGSILIPLIEETLNIGKRTVATGKVRLQKTVQVYQEALNEPLAVRTFDIERVVLNQPVETAPPVRQEGDTTVYPLVEEQLILTKQLILKEELRVTRRDTERVDTQVVTLHREHLTVERLPVDEA